MTGRVAAVRNRLLVAAAAVLLAALLGWTSDAGLLLVLVAVVATAAAVMRGLFGGLGVLLHWLLRYRAVDVGLRELGDIIGEHTDDMQRAGLAVPQPRSRPLWRRRNGRGPRDRPDLVPRLRHRPYPGGILVTLEAVRAGMSQDEIVRAVPRLRSAWGVDVIEARKRPGGRAVELRIPLGEDATDTARSTDRDEAEEAAASRQGQGDRRPPDAPPVTVVQGRDDGSDRTQVVPTRGERSTKPPTFRPAPALEPDERGRYELEMLPLDAARTFSPSAPESTGPDLPEEPNPSTAELPLAVGVTSEEPESEPPGRDADPLLDGTRNPTDIDERSLRIGAQWRTGKER